MRNLSSEQFGIKVEGVETVQHKRTGATFHRGRVAEGQTGYRMVKEGELDPQMMGNYHQARGYHSRGGFLAGPEKHSRGSTMVSATPLSADDMHRYGATHQLEVDISGMPFRTLRRPEGNTVHADVGLGLGVVGEMRWDRIRRVTDRHGKDAPTDPGMGNPGEAIEVSNYMDTGARARGR